jgi:hypothetical protein
MEFTVAYFRGRTDIGLMNAWRKANPKKEHQYRLEEYPSKERAPGTGGLYDYFH